MNDHAVGRAPDPVGYSVIESGRPPAEEPDTEHGTG
jgi:hypothetical protein